MDVHGFAWGAAVVIGLAGCASSGSSTTSEPTVLSVPATTAPPSATAAASTDAATTTVAPTTIVDTGELSFEIVDARVTPIATKDGRAVVNATHAEVSGGIDGTMTSTAMAVESSELGVMWFEGTAGDCGSGGLAIRQGARPDGTAGWEIVEGLGTGDLTSAAGGGTVVGSRFEGTLDCRRTTEPGTLSTSLLEPVPESGTPTGVPIHQSGPSTTYDVPAHPDQASTPRIFVVEATMNPGYMFQLYIWKTDASGGVLVDCAPELCNTGVFWWFLPDDVCGGEIVARAIVDNVELPPYSGGWDIPAAQNGGIHGGGTFDAQSWDNGRVLCA